MRSRPEVDPLKYQGGADAERKGGHAARELLTLKLRYQPPSGGASKLLAFPVEDSGSGFAVASTDLQFTAAVASFGMLLRNSRFKGSACYDAVIETASSTLGNDRKGQRREFLEVVRTAQRLSGERVGAIPLKWQPEFRSFGVPLHRIHPAETPANVFTMGLIVGAVTIALFACAIVGLTRVAVFVSLLCRGQAKCRSC
jgi:hypothetical protein